MSHHVLVGRGGISGIAAYLFPQDPSATAGLRRPVIPFLSYLLVGMVAP